MKAKRVEEFVRGAGQSLLLLVSLGACGHAQSVPQAVVPDPQAVARVYDRVLAQVNAIPIFDNHSHPGFADDPDVDAMTSPPGAVPVRLRPDNPELIAASKDLFDYAYSDGTPEHLKWLASRKAELRREKTGDAYFSGILDRLKIEHVMANRVRMAPYLAAKRFGWIFFVDSVLFPFDNSHLKARNADQAVYLPLQEKKLSLELRQEGLEHLPANLDAYLAFVAKLVEDNQHRGGQGIKFEIAYFRTLQFSDPPRAQAENTYAKYASGGTPSDDEYAAFQDYVFRFLLLEAGKRKLPVQIHTAVGVGDSFSVSGGNVLNLENILRDPRYEATTFVLLHGGYPFQYQAIWLAARKNVYLDTSLMELYLYPAALKETLRQWLLLFPEKIVFGSDAFPFSEAVGAEESYWMAVRSARVALAAALAEMIAQHELSEEQAMRFARAYLHDTAAQIYAQ